MSAARVNWHVNAPRAKVYRALLDAEAVATWMVPAGMSSRVHALEAREGGTFRISLTYDVPTGTGKTSAQTDTFHGRFVQLVPNERVVEIVEFETAAGYTASERGHSGRCTLGASPHFPARQQLRRDRARYRLGWWNSPRSAGHFRSA